MDSFLDASLVFARDSQIYLLGLMSGSVSAETRARMEDSFAAFMAGIDQALNPNREFLVGDQITLADICFVAELCLFHNERPRLDLLRTSGLSAILDDSRAREYPAAFEHLARLRKHAAFAPDVEPYLVKLGRVALSRSQPFREEEHRGRAYLGGTFDPESSRTVGLSAVRRQPEAWNPTPIVAKNICR